MKAKASLAAGLSALAVLGAAPAWADNYETQSGVVLCGVTPDETLALVGPNGLLPADPARPYDAVVCEGHFTQPGAGYNAVTTGNGSFYWENANLAVYNPTTKMSYGQTYRSGVWTIYHDQNGTRFTNNVTGHGMFVSIENVYAF